MKVRIKAGNAVNLVERRLRAPGKGFEFHFRQEAVAKLDRPQVVEDHVVRLARMRRARFTMVRGAKWRAESTAYYWPGLTL